MARWLEDGSYVSVRQPGIKGRLQLRPLQLEGTGGSPALAVPHSFGRKITASINIQFPSPPAARNSTTSLRSGQPVAMFSIGLGWHAALPYPPEQATVILKHPNKVQHHQYYLLTDFVDLTFGTNSLVCMSQVHVVSSMRLLVVLSKEQSK